MKNRFEWIDLGKGISMFMVLLYHSEVYFPMCEHTYSYLFDNFYLPFFFFLSGYLFTSNHQTFSFKRKMLQVFRGIIWTYFVFTIIIWIPKSVVHGTAFWDGFKEIILGWASWFVVALGGAEIMFAFILYRTNKLWIIVFSIFLALICGYCIKYIHPERLPFQFDKMFLVMFFLGLGFLYRLCEKRIHFYVKVNVKNFILLVICYYALYYYATKYLHISLATFFASTNSAIFLSVFCAVVGIFMMTFFVKLIPANKQFCFIGKNSLVFYYLNGGVITVLSTFFVWGGFYLPTSVFGYTNVVLMAVTTSFVITAIVKVIRKYCPVLIGDKLAFNTLAKRMHLNIEF